MNWRGAQRGAGTRRSDGRPHADRAAPVRPPRNPHNRAFRRAFRGIMPRRNARILASAGFRLHVERERKITDLKVRGGYTPARKKRV